MFVLGITPKFTAFVSQKMKGLDSLWWTDRSHCVVLVQDDCNPVVSTDTSCFVFSDHLIIKQCLTCHLSPPKRIKP